MRLQRLVEKVKEPADRIQARRGLEVLIALGTPEAKELVETPHGDLTCLTARNGQ